MQRTLTLNQVGAGVIAEAGRGDNGSEMRGIGRISSPPSPPWAMLHIILPPPSPPVLHMLGDNHIHRVYVCEGGRVRSVITPTDILRWASGKANASPAAAATAAEGAAAPTKGIAAARPVAVA